MISQAKLYTILHEHRSPIRLYEDDRDIWELAGEMVKSKDGKIKEITERLINKI